MEKIFHSHAIKTHFHKKGCALGLILEVRVFGTQKWPAGSEVWVTVMHTHNMRYKYWCIHSVNCAVSLSLLLPFQW